MDACEGGLKRFIEQTGNTDEPVEVLSLGGGKNITSDALWLAGEILPEEKVVRFACDVALINIEKVKTYTDEYDLIVDFLNNPTARAAAAAAAADAANAAAAAGYDTARASYAATAAVAACYATIADAADRADAAVDFAYAADATNATREQINQLLVKLFEDC